VKLSCKVQEFNLNRLITCKVRYFKPLFVIMLMIMDYSPTYEKEFISHNHQKYNK